MVLHGVRDKMFRDRRRCSPEDFQLRRVCLAERAKVQIPTHSSNNVPLLFMMLSLKDKPQESEIIVKELTGLGRSSSGSGQSDSDGNFASAYTDNDAVTYINELKDKIHELENNVGCGCEDRGSEAMIRVQCPDINYPAAKLMDALRDLDFQVHHASVSSVRELMLQDSVVKVPDGIISEEVMRTAIYQMMQN
ncbi:hypothetical protein JRO89_XS10G0131500 [Xanthoceras sorbifolium]|uniref:Transcription factor n=1 Tax=Xanthoceras sorbifolium TaxID=99658 RepID=A0ABQ8HIH5_9ROSI|nr:hypothetical protein JRO89_XS10G0131500 [Xanthoceras sorbifolium]